MHRYLVAVISCFTLIVCISQQAKPKNKNQDYFKTYTKADKLYRDAESLSGTKGFSDEDEETMNKMALEEFRRAIELMKSTGQKNDSLAFFCYLKTGILEHYFGNITEAKVEYLNCIQSKINLRNLADSFLFKPYLYTGTIYYLQDEFDSAFIFYKKAEQVINNYAVTITETERLYNTFGSIYMSTGNYRQAKNYFEKAISVLPPSHPYYTALLVNYKINTAGALIQLEDYEKADSIYQSVLPFHINTNEIEHNIGLINLYTGKYHSAIGYFKKTSY
ncbi:MAG: tetratricopeptide repeat protein [Bacteroidota bacterium]